MSPKKVRPPVNNPNTRDRRRLKRRNITYYLPILDSITQKVIGHLVDISPVGLLMDSKIPFQPNQSYELILNLMAAIDGKDSLEFVARSKWCRIDSAHPYLYNAGFEIPNIAPEDIEVIKHLAAKYGAG